ncbi:hypothetical protein P43SY_009998 [Pythium insidiosum]|uniref:Kazal-like domain-containing protein n=1 Tax=Pythium insidiosum TaxID=114742 RepID=A0AAD5LEF0_PYTIN|nr:hypothetical protein P43SY_009998 [Pythium insidiosum]
MSSACARACGPFETCFVYNGAEYCAPTCADGLCNSAQGELCVLKGQACSVAPCMPVATCVSRSSQSPPQPEFPAARAECQRDCPLSDNPVCGSDGVSYLNACVFQQAQCEQPALTIASIGLCYSDVVFRDKYSPSASGSQPPASAPSACEGSIICAGVDDPVCTSKGTMRNLCFWQRARCSDPSLQLLSRSSPCETADLLPTCPTVCTEAFVPVCASNGVIYANECLFRQAKCARRGVGELRRVDLSYCELLVGDSIGAAVDLATVLAFTTPST